MRKSLLIIFTIVLLRADHRALGQGCSDAGICSIGSLKNSSRLDAMYHSLTFSNTLGMGEAGGSIVYIQTTQVEGRIVIAGRGYFNLKLPVQFVSGNLSRSTFGLGDLSVSYSHRLITKPDAAFSITLGGRLPLNQSTLKEEGLPLPMQYQSSLGSVDFLIGASLLYSSWHFALGYQHPFSRNENKFLRALWPDDSDAQDYFESNLLRRGDDLVLRIEKSFRSGRRTIFVGILPIYRLQKDEITRNGQVVKLKGSDELTLNLNFNYLYNLNEKVNLRFSIGSPVIWRKTRADGLTRPVVITAAFERKF